MVDIFVALRGGAPTISGSCGVHDQYASDALVATP
jgi:hypothetical protein